MPKHYSYYSRKTPYLKRSRAAKKKAYMQVLNQIRRAAPVLGGHFYTPNYIHGKNNWIDLKFLGDGFPIYYNVSLQTTRFAYEELVWAEASDRADLLVPDRDDWFDQRVKDPKTGNYVITTPEPKRPPGYGGLTRFEWINAQLKPIADAKTIQAHENWSIQHSYHYGIGLHVTLDVPYITTEVVNSFIERFLNSPKAFQNPQPRSYAYDEIEHWGMKANAVAEPWGWGQATKDAGVENIEGEST